MYLKLGALIWLCLHNSVHNLLIRYSRARNVETMYFSSVAVLFTEIIKVILCFIMIVIEEGGFMGFRYFNAIQKQIIVQPKDTIKICIPSILYTIQNNLLFIAASHLEAVTFAVVSQLKIFSAAVFSVIILERQLSHIQWISFIILFSGVALVQNDASSTTKLSQNDQEQSPIFGFAMACLACGISGFAGIVLEKIFKGSAPVSLWMRNIQMAVFSIPASFAGILIQDGTKVIEHGFLFGFDSVVWFTVFWYGIGGLSAAVCIKYADSISKDFATSLAIILATIGSIYIFEFIPNFYFIFGATLFVTIGYSMAYNKIYTMSDVKYFYLHQIRNIIPLYSTTILINLLYNGWLYEPGHYFRIVYDALWSLSFTKYDQIIKYGFQPFNLINENGSLLHSWFLSAQIKFCIYAPLVSHFCHESKKSLFLLIIIATESFLLYFFNSTETSTLVTFFPRLWQYLIGVMGFLLDDIFDEELFEIKILPKFITNNVNKFHIVSLLLLNICLFYPFSSNLYSVSYRVFISFAAIFIIKLKKRQKILTAFTQYIGETSYVLYLIHPLLITYSILWGLTNITGFKVIIFIGSLIISILIQELFQESIKRLSMLTVFSFIIFEYALIIYFCSYFLFFPLS